jgi:hypothetical protein
MHTSTSTPRRAGATRTAQPAPTTAILVPGGADRPRKPTWQEQLTNVKQNGPSGTGRKNRGPRRTIKPHIAQDESKAPPPNSVDAQLRRWQELTSPTQQGLERQRRGDVSSNNGGGGGGVGDAERAPSSSSSGFSGAYYGYNVEGPQQLEETFSYSFLKQSTVRYPFSTADPSDPVSKGIYRDSKADKLSIEFAVTRLAEVGGGGCCFPSCFPPS